MQLSIECVEPTSACYTAVGRSLTAQRLLLAQVAEGAPKRHDKSLRVTLTLLDVESERSGKHGGASSRILTRRTREEVEWHASPGGTQAITGERRGNPAPARSAAQ